MEAPRLHSYVAHRRCKQVHADLLPPILVIRESSLATLISISFSVVATPVEEGLRRALLGKKVMFVFLIIMSGMLPTRFRTAGILQHC